MAQLAVCRGALTKSASPEKREKEDASPAAKADPKAKPAKADSSSKSAAKSKKESGAQSKEPSAEKTKVTRESKKVGETDKPQHPPQ